ncbi:hypothetical protein HDU97_002603 [Phlyctochytrium planicorne]|nr:hypothetical protein HDU97_002603 [Phlyctochytrium planicorne]
MFRILNPTPFSNPHHGFAHHPAYYDPEDEMDETPEVVYIRPPAPTSSYGTPTFIQPRSAQFSEFGRRPTGRSYGFDGYPAPSTFGSFSRQELEEEYFRHQQAERQLELERQRERARIAAIHAELERRKWAEESIARERQIQEILRLKEIEHQRRRYLAQQRQLQQKRQRQILEQQQRQQMALQQARADQEKEAFGRKQDFLHQLLKAALAEQHMKASSQSPAPSSQPAPSKHSPELTLEAKLAGRKIFHALRDNVPRLKALRTLNNIDSSFQALISSPETSAVLATSPEALAVDATKKALVLGAKANSGIAGLEEKLTRLLVEADTVESWGSEQIRTRRKSLVKSIFSWVEKIETLKQSAVAAALKTEVEVSTAENEPASVCSDDSTPDNMQTDDAAAALEGAVSIEKADVEAETSQQTEVSEVSEPSEPEPMDESPVPPAVASSLQYDTHTAQDTTNIAIECTTGSATSSLTPYEINFEQHLVDEVANPTPLDEAKVQPNEMEVGKQQKESSPEFQDIDLTQRTNNFENEATTSPEQPSGEPPVTVTVAEVSLAEEHSESDGDSGEWEKVF